MSIKVADNTVNCVKLWRFNKHKSNSQYSHWARAVVKNVILRRWNATTGITAASLPSASDSNDGVTIGEFGANEYLFGNVFSFDKLNNDNRIWTDGVTIYKCVSSNYDNNTQQCQVFDPETLSWSEDTVTIYGTATAINGYQVWINNGTVHFTRGWWTNATSNYDESYVYNKSSRTWTRESCNIKGLDGSNIWHDSKGNIYCSQGARQHKLNKSTGQWVEYEWNDLPGITGYKGFWGKNVWHCGDVVILSANFRKDSTGNTVNMHYILNEDTNTWESSDVLNNWFSRNHYTFTADTSAGSHLNVLNTTKGLCYIDLDSTYRNHSWHKINFDKELFSYAPRAEDACTITLEYSAITTGGDLGLSSPKCYASSTVKISHNYNIPITFKLEYFRDDLDPYNRKIETVTIQPNSSYTITDKRLLEYSTVPKSRVAGGLWLSYYPVDKDTGTVLNYAINVPNTIYNTQDAILYNATVAPAKTETRLECVYDESVCVRARNTQDDTYYKDALRPTDYLADYELEFYAAKDILTE